MSDNLKREIQNIALGTLALGAVQAVVTILTGHFGLAAIFGTLLGCVAAIFNFTLMGIILEQCIARQGGASYLAGVGYILRLAIIAAVIIWAMKASYLNYVCAAVPLIFPQLVIFIISIARKNERKDDERS